MRRVQPPKQGTIACLAIIACTLSTPAPGTPDRSPPDPFRGAGPTEIHYVGSGPGCDFATIQSAVDAAASGAEVRVVAGTGYGSVDIGNVGSLAIRGGYADCSATTPGGRSTLDGGDSDTVMDLFTFQDPVTLELENLTLQNGAGVSLAGGLQIDGPAHVVVLRDVLVDSNSATLNSGNDFTGHGAGIRINSADGAELYLVENTVVANNSADSQGGGIHCDASGGTRAVIALGGTGAIHGNSAATGGGVYTRNCSFISRAGGFLLGIYNNQAVASGGGIYAAPESVITLRGDDSVTFVPGNPQAPATLSGNTAGAFGGGAFLKGPDTIMETVDSVIANNDASSAGGGVAVDGANFEMRRDEDTDCVSFGSTFSEPPCSRLRDNSAGTDGGAVSASGFASTVEISQTFISGNSANGNGAAIRANLVDATLEGVVVHDHSANNLFQIENSGSLTLGWSTVAGNTPGAGNAIIVAASNSGDDTQLDIFSSIIHQPGIEILDQEPVNGGLISVNTVDCLIAHELSTLPGDTRSQIADPEFKDTASDNYHITAESPAVDFCDDSNAPTRPDMDAQARGTSIFSGQPPWDVGADEFYDTLFSDRFQNPGV